MSGSTGQDAIDAALAIAHGSQSNKMHTGAIHSAVGGRTDHLPMTVPSNSYVLPADVVSGLPGAEGNTLAGARLLDEMLKRAPYNSPTGAAPYGSSKSGPYGIERRAPGGPMPDNGDKGVEIVAAGGEFVIAPHHVKIIGGGNIKHGHAVLDHFVKSTRDANVKTLKKLPGPVKDPTK